MSASSRRPRTRPLALAATGVLLSSGLALGHADAVAAPVAAAPVAAAADPFYTPPATLPAQNGALVRTAPQRLGVSLTLPGGSAPIPGTATKIMYRSTDELGRPVAVTGSPHRAVRAVGRGRSAPAGRLRRGHPGPGRRLRAVEDPGVAAPRRAGPDRARLRAAQHLRTAPARRRRGGHRLRRARHDRPGAHLHQPPGPGPRRPRRRPRRDAGAGHVGHPGLAGRPLRLLAGWRRDRVPPPSSPRRTRQSFGPQGGVRRARRRPTCVPSSTAPTAPR